MDWKMTALRQSGFPPRNGANGNAHLFVVNARRSTKHAISAAVCIHADPLQKEESSEQDTKDSETHRLSSALRNHKSLIREPAEALGCHQSDARTIVKQKVRLIVA